MSGKSRHRKVKFKQQEKKGKSKRKSQVNISRQEIIPPVEEVVTNITNVAVSTPAIENQSETKNPELFFELRRIGIFGGIIFITLILLVIFLG